MKKQTYKKLFNVAIATTMATGAVVAVAPTQAGATTSFTDVKESDVHYKNIMNLAERGIISGYGNGTYGPNKSVTRGQVAKIIAGVLGLDTKNVQNPNFTDVPTSNEYYGPIAALVEAGIINGYGDGTYGPSNTLTRGQMAKIITNAFKLVANNTENPFTDIEKSAFKENILALYANEITTGKTATTYDAISAVTRAQLASFVVRAEATVADKESNIKVEQTLAISSVKAGTIVVNGKEFEVSEELATVFNEENANALENAEVVVVVEYTNEPVASLTPVFANGKGKIKELKRVKLVKEDAKFNPQGYNIPKIEVVATSITLTNIKSENLELAQGAKVTLENVSVENLALAENTVVSLVDSNVIAVDIKGAAKLTVDANTKLEKAILEEGKTLADVIANYDEVKEQLKDVTVEEEKPTEPTEPTTPGSNTGDSTGGGTAVKPTDNVDFLNELVTNLQNGTMVNVAITDEKTNTPVLTITATDSDLTKGQLSKELKTLLKKLVSDTTSSTAPIKSVTITKTYTKDSVLNDLFVEDKTLNELGNQVAKELAAKITGKTEADLVTLFPTDDTEIFDKLTSPLSGEIKIEYKNGAADTLTIKIVKK